MIYTHRREQNIIHLLAGQRETQETDTVAAGSQSTGSGKRGGTESCLAAGTEMLQRLRSGDEETLHGRRGPFSPGLLVEVEAWFILLLLPSALLHCGENSLAGSGGSIKWIWGWLGNAVGMRCWSFLEELGWGESRGVGSGACSSCLSWGLHLCTPWFGHGAWAAPVRTPSGDGVEATAKQLLADHLSPVFCLGPAQILRIRSPNSTESRTSTE